MFLRPYTRRKSGKTHHYYALVESVRTEKGPRQRVVAHLGELNHSEERRWQRTAVFYNRQGEAQQLRLFPDDGAAFAASGARRGPRQVVFDRVDERASLR